MCSYHERHVVRTWRREEGLVEQFVWNHGEVNTLIFSCTNIFGDHLITSHYTRNIWLLITTNSVCVLKLKTEKSWPRTIDFLNFPHYQYIFKHFLKDNVIIFASKSKMVETMKFLFQDDHVETYYFYLQEWILFLSPWTLLSSPFSSKAYQRSMHWKD